MQGRFDVVEELYGSAIAATIAQKSHSLADDVPGTIENNACCGCFLQQNPRSWLIDITVVQASIQERGVAKDAACLARQRSHTFVP